MQATQIHYDRIGSFPDVEHLANTLDATIKMYEKSRENSVKQFLGTQICRAAEHFYGLVVSDYGSVSDLIDAVRGMDQHLAVH